MTDKMIPLDSATQALRLAEVEGRQELLASEVRQNMTAFRSTLETMQADVRGMSNSLREFAGLQHGSDANNKAIEEVKTVISKLTDKLDHWADEFDRENRAKWEQHDRDRDAWREKHEADNQQTKERLVLWSGVGFSFLLLGGAIVSGFVYFLNVRFAESDADVLRLEQAQTEDRQQRADVLRSVHAIQLYIAEQKGAQK